MSESAAEPQATPPAAQVEEANPMQALQDHFGPQLEELQERLLEANEQVVGFIKKNPGATLLGAAAVGFVIGRLASRR